MTLPAYFPRLGTIAIEEHQHDSIVPVKPYFWNQACPTCQATYQTCSTCPSIYDTRALHASLQNVNFEPLSVLEHADIS